MTLVKSLNSGDPNVIMICMTVGAIRVKVISPSNGNNSIDVYLSLYLPLWPHGSQNLRIKYFSERAGERVDGQRVCPGWAGGRCLPPLSQAGRRVGPALRRSTLIVHNRASFQSERGRGGMDDVSALVERWAVHRLCPGGRHQPQQEDHPQRGRRETRGTYSSAAPCFLLNYPFNFSFLAPVFSFFINIIYKVVFLPPFNLFLCSCLNFFFSSFHPSILTSFLSYFLTPIFLPFFFPYFFLSFLPSFLSISVFFLPLLLKKGQFVRKQVHIHIWLTKGFLNPHASFLISSCMLKIRAFSRIFRKPFLVNDFESFFTNFADF